MLFATPLIRYMRFSQRCRHATLPVLLLLAFRRLLPLFRACAARHCQKRLRYANITMPFRFFLP